MMKYLILIIFFFVLGACSTKSNVFDDANGTTKSSSDKEIPDNESNQEEAGETTVQNTPDKAIDMGETNRLPEIEGTERLGAICTHKKNSGDVRTVSVIDTKEGHCGTVYTKFSKKKTEAYAKTDMSFCEKVYGGILNNLMGEDGSGPFNCEGDNIPETSGGMENSTDGGSGEEQPGKAPEENPSSGEEVQGEGQQQPGGDGSTESEQDDEAVVQFMDVSTFLQMRRRERISTTCKNGEDERIISVFDTMEGPCGVVQSDNSEEKLETFSRHDMSKCDDTFNKLVNQFIGKGFNCRGDGFSAEEEGETNETPPTNER